MLLHAVCDQVAGVYDVLLTSLEGDLMDLAFATQSKQTTASGVCVTPVGDALLPLAKFRAMRHSFLTMLVFTRGDRLRVCPVHARSAFLCVTIQSNLPSR